MLFVPNIDNRFSRSHTKRIPKYGGADALLFD